MAGRAGYGLDSAAAKSDKLSPFRRCAASPFVAMNYSFRLRLPRAVLLPLVLAFAAALAAGAAPAPTSSSSSASNASGLKISTSTTAITTPMPASPFHSRAACHRAVATPL